MAGTGSTSSSLTSTSHTLTHLPTGGAALSSSGMSSSAVGAFLAAIDPSQRHLFLQPPRSIPAGSLQVVKDTLDGFAAQVSDEQQERLRTKRKREGGDRSEVLKIRKVHVDGFETGQVWQQAKRIIGCTLKESKAALKELEDNQEIQVDGVEEDEDSGQEISSDEEDVDEDRGSASSGLDEEESDMGSDVEDSEFSDAEELAMEGIEEGGEEEEDEDDEDEEEDDDLDGPTSEFVEDPNGLNDGFFSIDDFNKQTQWFEDQDARADPNTDQVSDEEEVDWHADPMAASKGKSGDKRAKRDNGNDIAKEFGLDEQDEEDDDDDDDNGPTFGDMDLDLPEGESGDEDETGLSNDLDLGIDLTANDVFYKDFFAPPPRKSKKGGGKKQARFHGAPEPDEADMERAMDDVKRDLFEDLSEHEGSEDELSDASAGDPRSRRSAHERRQAKVASEIRRLEAELVAKRAWTLSGEATAADRPVNSLLEEDLDFEHVGKPVPVITEEVSESIEALIKRRILAQEFDEVLRRRPDDLDNPSNARRGLVELDDSKSKQGLAEIYEEEHIKNSNPEGYVSAADEKLRREEREIEALWRDTSAKLDALSSWHYKPKPAAPSLTVVADVATIAMEDAQPTTAQGVSGGESMIAPQEVYKAGKDTAEKGDVVAKSGLPVARQEMSREEKVRRRRREKERIRKAGGTDAKGLSKKALAQKDTLGDLKKGGVRIINRKGEVVDMNGKVATSSKPATSGSFKL